MIFDGTTIACYEHAIPPFVEAELHRLYGNVFSSLAQFRIYGGLSPATNTYVVRSGETITTIFLFTRDKDRVHVLNEGIRLDDAEVTRFADYVFKTWRGVGVITFRAVQADIHRLPFAHQKCNHSEDIVLDLPASADEYTASLGKRTRKNIRYYMSRLTRNYPTFSYRVYSKDEVGPQHIKAIAALNHARMADKNKQSDIDEEEVRQLTSMARECGMVGVIMIDGRICAGAICSQSGPNFFLNVIGHDPAYDEDRIGTLCCYLTICESIARGGKEFHFLWGRYEYKFLLLGVLRDLDNLVIYRSGARYLLNSNIALRTAARGVMRRAKLWLDEGRREGHAVARHISASLELLRSLKRAGFALVNRPAK